MNKKITIIGAGAVGSSIGYLLVAESIASEVVFIDVNKDKASGEAMDIYQSTPFLSPAIVKAGEYEDAKGSDIVVITSGVARKPGQTRIDLAKINVGIPPLELNYNTNFLIRKAILPLLTKKY